MKTRFLLLSTLFLSGAAFAADDWREVNIAIVKQHIVPRYEQLASAGKTLEKSATEFCAAPDAAKLNNLQQAFHQSMDAWSGIQHLRVGPVELLSRYHRFQLWPDKHNTGSRQLNKVLAEQEMELLQPQRFSRTSAAVQGLSSLERLIFSEKHEASAFSTDGKPSYRCLLAQAISHNIAAMAAELVEEWSVDEPPFYTLFISRGHEMERLMNDKSLAEKLDVSTRFYNNMTTQVQSIIDQKLVPVMGESSAKAKARSAESWRSQRSLRNIVLNLKAVESLYDVAFSPRLQTANEGKQLDQQVHAALQAALSAAQAISTPLALAVEQDDKRAALEVLLQKNRELLALLTGPVPQALGIPFSFNALDGD